MPTPRVLPLAAALMAAAFIFLALASPLAVAAAAHNSPAAEATSSALEGSPSGPASRAEFESEKQLALAATKAALAGDITGAWKLLSADLVGTGKGSVPLARGGWRAASVAGFLRNQGRDAVANEFVRTALAHPRDKATARAPSKERADVLFWRATLAERVGQREQALEWLRDAADLDPDSKQIADLRRRVADADKSFPKTPRCR